ncbi:hypothetical protein ILUMI_14287 [Ignelater luminosus]|uniref:Glucose-methanol-choline oxidoreductase N-terminal domain-containing protein n=1 Tax=Ignelater luminosus TaxID=2038154 RepID=A0A8K0GAL8_IGNLU|nr:hypothetical protein ILUMI_14287 [Ignelater luminosus]
MKNIIILCFATLLVLSKQDQEASKESVQYYQSLLQYFLKNSSKWEKPKDSRKFFKLKNEEDEAVNHGHYHFIIVGAGVAGSVLAHRLTESGKFQALLLEAGGPENDFTDVPGFAPYLARSDFNWGYKTIPQNNSCLGFKNKQCNYHRGRAIRGTSVINFLIYVRGNKEDFYEWGKDNPGWDYENVLPYFKKSENSTLDLEDPGYHGKDGPLSVEYVKYQPEVLKIFLEAAKQRGQNILDYNGQNQNGYSTFQSMTRNGKRCSVKILIRNITAFGIEFIREGKKYRVTASKEVIISGGTINSPQLLLLSGIGPKEHLVELGIPVIKDLPVGKIFHDYHVYIGLLFSTNMSTKSEPPLEEHIKNDLKGRGLLTAAITITGGGFENPKIPHGLPSVEYGIFSGLIEEITKENWEALTKALSGKYIYDVVPSLLHPKSKGTVKLKTKDPLDFPVLESNIFTDENRDDMKEMLTFIKYIFKISKTPVFQSIDSRYK